MDRSHRPDNPLVNHTIASWDVVSVSGGMVFPLWRAELTLGAIYSSGSGSLTGSVNLTAPGVDQLITENRTTVQYRRVKGVLGFTFSL